MLRQKTVQVGFRFPETLVSRLDALVEAAHEAQPGSTVSRAALVRRYLIEALDRAEARARAKTQGKRRAVK